MQSVDLIPKCAECEAHWLSAGEERWRDYLGVDEDLDEPAELDYYCRRCAEREFGDP